MEQDQHVLTIENRKRVTATQIEAVDSFSPTQLVLSYAGGRIVISGSGMKIISFSKSNGGFAATGVINSARYVQKGLGIKRLFR